MHRLFSATTSSSETSNPTVCEKSTQICEDEINWTQQQSELKFSSAHQHYQYVPTKNYVGLALPQWYRPKAQSTLLRRRTRSRQWVTYEVEVDSGQKKLIKRPNDVSAVKPCVTGNNQLQPGNNLGKSISVKNVIKPVNLTSSKSVNSKRGSTPKYHLMKGFVSDVDDNNNGQEDDVIDETEPQQKIKLVVLLLMIPSIAVMFYSQSKFRRESNVVGDLSGLGLPHNYLSGGIGPGSFGTRDFTSKPNPIYDSNSDDSLRLSRAWRHLHTNTERNDATHHDFSEELIDKLENRMSDENLNVNVQQSNNNQNINPDNENNNQKKSMSKSNFENVDERRVNENNQANHLNSESELMWIKVNNLKTISGYRVILYENANQLNDYNHLSTSESTFSHCPQEKRCLITNDINLINISDAIIFTNHHLSHLTYSNLKREQLAQFIVDNHLISIFYSLSPIQWSSSLRSKFNLTLTYNYQANITYRPVLVEKKLIDGVRGQNLDDGQIDGQSSDNKTNAFDLWRNKRKLVLIVTYNCSIDQELITFATIMERVGIDVDLVSLCDKKLCPSIVDNSSLESCFQSIAEPYLFLFDWQSLICPQFVSPLVYLSLAFNLVPIVAHPNNFGKNNYNLPENSFINSLNFSSLHELADHLNLVASDLDQYSTYIQWRQTHEISLARNDLCHLCSSLHGDHSALNSHHTFHEKLAHQQSADQHCTYWKNVYTFTELTQKMK